MSRIVKTLGLGILLSVVLAACNLKWNNKKPESTSQYTPGQIAEAIISSQDSISILQPLFPDEDYYIDYLTNIYQLDSSTIKDGTIYYANGMLADEIAIFIIENNSSSSSTKDTLMQYKERRTDAFRGYAPEQAAILENGIVTTYGRYVALIICENPQTAEKTFLACFGSNPPEIKESIATPSSRDEDVLSDETTASSDDSNNIILPIEPADNSNDDIEDVYNSAAIIEAWRSGDKAGLSSKNRSVLDACVEIIAAVIRDDMSDYEKELAINDWIVDWTDYDKESKNNSPNAKPDPDNNNPYGAIFHKKSICSGYTSTFQLFMDLLEIECISVDGIYKNTGGQHAWNMVRIDNYWYCVDVTWNDPSGGIQSDTTKHKYFNVTTEYMRDTGHQWDESTTPVADAGKLYYE